MKRYGIIGFPLGHSFSKGFFSEKFINESIDAEYLNFGIPSLELFPQLIIGNRGLAGLNVTIPYKIDIIRYLNELSDDAGAIGAVNVITVDRSGEKPFLKGYNTDFIGFIDSLKPVLGERLPKALVLGTGGASLAVTYGLSIMGIDFRLVSRDKARGDFTYEELSEEIVNEFSLIINTTPAGIGQGYPEAPPFPFMFLSSGNILYDLVYGYGDTVFLTEGKKRGCIVKGGLEMLQIQALRAWDIWNKRDLR